MIPKCLSCIMPATARAERFGEDSASSDGSRIPYHMTEHQDIQRDQQHQAEEWQMGTMGLGALIGLVVTVLCLAWRGKANKITDLSTKSLTPQQMAERLDAVKQWEWTNRGPMKPLRISKPGCDWCRTTKAKSYHVGLFCENCWSRC